MSHRVLALRTLQGYYRGEQEVSPLRKQGIPGICMCSRPYESCGSVAVASSTGDDRGIVPIGWDKIFDLLALCQRMTKARRPDN